MRSIIRKVESWAPPAKSLSFDQMFELSDSKEDAMAAAAVFMSKKLGASMILVEGKFGNMARLVSNFRPSVPILSVKCTLFSTITMLDMRLDHSVYLPNSGRIEHCCASAADTVDR